LEKVNKFWLSGGRIKVSALPSGLRLFSRIQRRRGKIHLYFSYFSSGSF